MGTAEEEERMKDEGGRMNMSSEPNRGASLSDKADGAFRQAAVKVVERARRTGTPVVIWEDGQVKEASPDQIEATLNTEN